MFMFQFSFFKLDILNLIKSFLVFLVWFKFYDYISDIFSDLKLIGHKFYSYLNYAQLFCQCKYSFITISMMSVLPSIFPILLYISVVCATTVCFDHLNQIWMLMLLDPTAVFKIYNLNVDGKKVKQGNRQPHGIETMN